MAKSRYQQEQYPSRGFLESAGAILFDFRPTGVSLDQLLSLHSQVDASGQKLQFTAEPSVAFIYSHPRQETLLPKGRRNINESREDAAIRETYEETGLRCCLLPVTLNSRATSVDPKQDRTNEGGYTVNEVRPFHETKDPFWVTVRQDPGHHQGDDHVKMIWWYIAVVDDVQDEKSIELDPGCELRLELVSKATDALTYMGDREILWEAIQVVQATIGIEWGTVDSQTF